MLYSLAYSMVNSSCSTCVGKGGRLWEMVGKKGLEKSIFLFADRQLAGFGQFHGDGNHLYLELYCSTSTHDCADAQRYWIQADILLSF